MFGSEFNAVCKDGWNRGVNTLMNAPKEDDDTGPGYNWRSHTPATRNHILELLRGDEMVDLSRSGNLVEVMGYVFKLGHGLTLQVGSSKWAKEGVNQLVDAMKYKCVMGNNVKGDANCTTHGFI